MRFFQIVCLSLALTLGNAGITTFAQNGNNYFLHTVSRGQSLYSIANMYHVSIDDIVRLNPGSDKQIRVGEALKIPQANSSSSSKNGRFHTIQAGETLYQLTVKYNISAQAICDANPGLSASNFRVGQVISIPTESVAAPVTPLAPAQSSTPSTTQKGWKEMHKVERKETIFSICQEYGITQEDLLALNPELKNGKLKKGMFIFIPYPKSSQPAATPTPTMVQTPSNEELFKQSKTASKSLRTIQAAVMLPFTASRSIKPEEQTRMVEYYEGFLIAVDSLKRQGVSVDLYTYDTKGSTNVISSILSKPEMKNMDIIFGPVHTSNIEPLANFAERNKIRLVVPFAPKVDQVFNNPMVYQINTPQSYFYSEAYDHFLRKFSKARIIFVDPANGDKEKNEFINGLKSELKDNRVDFKQIQLSSEIAPERIIAAMDTLRENIFIPTSGRSSALTRILPQLTNVLRSHPHFDMHLFGYPEWQTYTQEHLASFYELDTYFYSSFYTNNLFPEAVRFTQSYRRWYSKDMANTFPKYGMLGFDTGYFFLKGLSQQGNKFEENLDKVSVTPIQTGFKFERVNNWGGFINRKVFFVHLTKNYELIKLDFE